MATCRKKDGRNTRLISFAVNVFTVPCCVHCEPSEPRLATSFTQASANRSWKQIDANEPWSDFEAPAAACSGQRR